MHPVTCSLLWVRCLFDRFSISGFGCKWPLKWKFSKKSFGIPRRDTELYVSWPNLVKIGRCEVAEVAERSSGLAHKKTRAPRDSSQPPFCPKWADRAKNSLNVVTPWHVHVYRIWPDRLRFVGLIPERLIVLARKSNYNIGFRLTIMSFINSAALRTRGQSNLTKSASRGAYSPVRGHPRGSKVVPLNSWGRVSY